MTNPAKKVLVAMSGGVDSSTAAGLLVQQGYEVTGVFMCLGQKRSPEGSQSCCSPEDGADAKAVADRLGIRFHVLNFQQDMDRVIDYFLEEYRRGRTPNPCLECNRQLKFGKLMEYADLLGIEYLATGHYARVIRDDHGQPELRRAVNIAKDQSYALFGIRRPVLSRVLLPLGEYRKEQVREMAAGMNLPVHEKAESQEICFVPDDDYGAFLARRAPELRRPGKVINTKGEILGEHEGIYKYTIGQRRGLGIALGDPAYVVRLDAATATVVLGSKDDLLGKTLTASCVNWLFDVPTESFPAQVQIRYNHRGAPAHVQPLTDETGALTRVQVEFDQPVSAITPGQAAVFYQDDKIIGGGTID